MCGSISRFSVLFRRSIYASRHTPEDCGFNLVLFQSCFGCARFLGELGLSSVRRQCLTHRVRYILRNRGVSPSVFVRTGPAPGARRPDRDMDGRQRRKKAGVSLSQCRRPLSGLETHRKCCLMKCAVWGRSSPLHFYPQGG